jgi:hypothetical protein
MAESKRIAFAALLLMATLPSGAGDLPADWFAATESDARALARCMQVPSEEQMQHELARLYHTDTKGNGPLFDLDGFRLTADRAQVRDLNDLTSGTGLVPSNPNKVLSDDDFQARHKQRKPDAQDVKAGRVYDLSEFQRKAPECHDIVCASRAIFGDNGIALLYTYKVLGLNLSRYQSPSAVDFSKDEIDAAIRAQLSLPLRLIQVDDKQRTGAGFYRLPKGSARRQDNGLRGGPGYILDSISSLSDAGKMYIFLHELGHMAAHRGKLPRGPAGAVVWERSEEWLQATDWNIHLTPQYEQTKQVFGAPSETPSKYARANPYEDFAETFAVYRVAPDRLEKISPKRYAFMKAHVFDRVEYVRDLCRGKADGSFGNRQQIAVNQ